jgi:replicative superfamily II helicase
MCTPDYNVAFVLAARTIVVQTAESFDSMRRERHTGRGFPQAFPQFL